jgi:type IV secretion system protein TrbE
MPECAWLEDEETPAYLHSTVSTKRHRVRLPEIPMYLDALLAEAAEVGVRRLVLSHNMARSLGPLEENLALI